MKLEYATSTLGDEADGDVITGFSGSNQRTNQVTALHGGASPFFAARGNNTNNFSFTIEQTATTIAAALERITTAIDELPGAGTLRFTESTFSAEMSALLTSVERVEFSGLHTIIRYNFIGGILTQGV